MSFCWCTVHVKDIDASIKFYEEIVGLKVAQRFGAGAMEIAFLGSGETKLELIGGAAARSIRAKVFQSVSRWTIWTLSLSL